MTDSSNKAMPLRIALLARPAYAAGLSADCFPSLTAAETISISDFSETTIMEKSAFEQALQAAVVAVNQGKHVRLIADTEQGNSQPTVLMLAGLTAAQNKIHPHAYLSGFADTLQQAIAQSLRPAGDITHQQAFDSLTAVQKFAAFYQLVEDIAGRTLSEQYWFTEPHKARVASLTFSQQSSVVLTQATGLQAPRSLLNSARLLFIVSGQNEAELQVKLAQLDQNLNRLAESDSEPHALISLMSENIKEYQAETANKPDSTSSLLQQVIVLQGASVAAVQQEISALRSALPKVMTEHSHYKTPAGSCFTPSPNSRGGVAFVYPGVGTVYPGMFRELHRYFPALYARLEREGNLKEMLQAEKTYGADPADMTLGELAIAGVGSSYLLTQLLCEEFAVKPDFALGYSKGEASMWASLGVWKNPHALIEMTQTSPIFTTAISGKLTAVREAWQLGDNDSITWNSFVVRSEPGAIQALLPEFPHAYLAIIQGDTCVLAGCESDCRALLKKLGKRGIAANRVTAMHTPPAMSQHQQVTEFYCQPLCDQLPEHIRFISAAGLLPKNQSKTNNRNQPVQIDSQSIADSIADTFCSTLDFTALIRSAREQGARLFIEVGADRQTCTLIDKINRADNVTTESCTIAANAKGGEDILTLLKCLGQLITHQIPLSLEPLLLGLEQPQMNASSEENDSLSANKIQGEPV